MFLLPEGWNFGNCLHVEGCEQTSEATFQKCQSRCPTRAEVPWWEVGGPLVGRAIFILFWQ